MKTIKSSKKTLILIPIILGLFVLGGCVKKEAKEKIMDNSNEELIKVFKEDNSKSNSKKVNTSNWKTYRNDHYGYQVSYPEDWEIFVSDYREPGSKWTDPMTLYIVKDCNLQQLEQKGTPCSNRVSIRTHEPTDIACAPVENKAKDGKLSVTISEAFHNIFTLKEGENRESLQYGKKLSCFIFDGIPQCVQCVYNFINDAIYFNDESCYSIEIKDFTKERKYLKIEEAIIESLKVVKKLN